MEVLKANSGITVLFKRAPSKLVSFRYFINCGSIDEKKKEEEGLCHALEHMYFAGTETRGWEELADGFRGIGGFENATTHYDWTEYNCTVPKAGFEKAFELLADMMYHSTFPEEKWLMEKQAIISEIEDYDDDPGVVISECIYEEGLGKNYHSIMGCKKNILQATPDDLVRFSNKYYSGSNVFVVVVGDLTERQVLNVVSRYDEWNPKKPAARKDPKFKFDPKRIKRSKKGIEQSYVYLMKPVSWGKKLRERAALDIATTTLSDYLFKELRDKQGLCYGIWPNLTEILPRKEVFLNIPTAISHHNLAKTPKAIGSAVESFLEGYLTSEHISRSRICLAGATMEAEESVEKMTKTMATWYLAGYKSDPFKSTYDLFETTSDTMVRKVAQENFSGEFKIGTLVGRK